MPTEELSKEYIERRLEDWKKRIASLYSTIGDWLSSQPSYTIKAQTEVTMYEELMEKFQVEPAKLNVLDIYHGNRIVATLKPIGLWLIGANGRIDILHKNGTITLVDKAEDFGHPEWFAFRGAKSYKGKPFNSDYLLELLEELENEHIQRA